MYNFVDLTGKKFNVKTDTGDVKIPSSVTGSGVCKIETNTGDIKITIKYMRKGKVKNRNE